MKTRRQAIGTWGEGLAERYLLERGYQILGKNVRTPYGEIDLIARLKDELVFVEVKTRTSQSYGLPETAITAKKQAHMIQAAQAYLQSNVELGDCAWRIDVIAITKKPGIPSPEIICFENALG